MLFYTQSDGSTQLALSYKRAEFETHNDLETLSKVHAIRYSFPLICRRIGARFHGLTLNTFVDMVS